ncbi:MAG TPA: Fe-S cluster assembly protein SufD [Candidatus Krumholzibacteria bacterium]|nr:Fe-S cluster assembly protein SufD [Candidatus Krumholzibacteria bacterium]
MPGVAVYQNAFAELEPVLRSSGPAWLHELRREGIDRFTELGFPSLKEEEWRFTRTRPIAEVDFRPAEKAPPIDAKILVARTFDDSQCHRLVLLNGRFDPSLSRISELPRGVRIGSLAEALRQDGDRIRELLKRGTRDSQRFAALNTAFLLDGVYIEIPEGVALDRPIHVVYVTSSSSAPTMTHPRVVIVAAKNSDAVVVESFFGAGEGAYFTNAVAQIDVGENAGLRHYRVQRESTASFHVGFQHAVLAKSARFATLSVTMGGSLVRNDIHTMLEGEGIDARVDGLYLAGARQHVDNHTFIRHGQPHCHSFELYKGILDDKARGVFNGRIFVDPVAQKTDAKQENNCMLLSDEARINSNPQLEIFADDVKCTHGAAIGKTDDTAIFYLRSRGIPHAEARDLMVYAFASEVLERIELEPLKRRLEGDLFDWLHAARAAV